MSEQKSALALLAHAASRLPIRLAPALAVVPTAMPVVAADTPTLSLTYLHYSEKNRMTVKEPILTFATPIGEKWELAAHATVDIMSGASPRFVSNEFGAPAQTLSSASIRDRRTAGDIKVTRKFDWGKLAVSRAESHEDDYHSHASGIEAAFEFNLKNTTLTVGTGKSNDRVGSSENVNLLERRDAREWLLGVTQLLSAKQLLQSNVQISRGEGFFNDPYKSTLSYYTGFQFPARVADTRPTERNSTAWLTRYRHHVVDRSATLKLDYRFFRDNWGLRSHTVEVAWSQDVGSDWRVEPSLRYYSQSAARFYGSVAPLDPTSSGRFPRVLPGVFSSDQRLAAFGSLTPGVKLTYQWQPQTRVEGAIAVMQQRGNWRLGGSGTAAFEPFRAQYVTVTVVHEL